MFKKPYEQCIFTIRNITDLNQCFEDGGNGKFEEGRRWIEGQRLKADADSKGQPLLVLFADAGSVGNILFYAVLQKIEVPLEGHQTTYTFKDLLPMPWPPLHKSELEMTDGRNISESHIRPYTICRTPASLLLSEEEFFASITPVEVDDMADENAVLEQELLEGEEAVLEPRFLDLSNVRIECYLMLQDAAFTLPKRDDQKLADLRSTQTGALAWDDTTTLIISCMLQGEYSLDITEDEIVKCVTIGDFVALVKSKVQ